ncbi:alpha/beta hydrolase family protein [Actinomyces timonensis]|uniref:alpha/beta hydrolase family protein n=1 Tax=Actinomyces timonensis TaxID=1288391 RepID=UPI0002D46167|nr:alpha/beta hydrolase [Actinomyces timonensis]
MADQRIEARIDTARGIGLAVELALPAGVPDLDPREGRRVVDTGGAMTERPEAIVILAHDFLADRHGPGQSLDRMAAAYREAGLATLQFDFSGLGASDDDVITLASEVADLQALCSWLSHLGYARQGIHGHGLGATAALVARPEQVRTAVAVGAIVGPQSILWEEVFSPTQLDELAKHGITRLPDDNPNDRAWDVVSKETLADVSMQSPDGVMEGLPWPILMVHGAQVVESSDAADEAAKGFPLLPDGSRMMQIHSQGEEADAELSRAAVDWMALRLR